MQLSDVIQLVKLLDKSGLTEISFKDGESQVTVKKEPSRSAAAPAVYAPAPSVATLASLPSPPEKISSAEKSGAKIKDVTSPMVGTFYASPTPGAEPFIQAGSAVKPGQVLCIIEAMKIMNEIESDVSGTVEEVCVPSETPVEYGTVLFRVRVA